MKVICFQSKITLLNAGTYKVGKKPQKLKKELMKDNLLWV